MRASAKIEGNWSLAHSVYFARAFVAFRRLMETCRVAAIARTHGPARRGRHEFRIGEVLALSGAAHHHVRRDVHLGRSACLIR